MGRFGGAMEEVRPVEEPTVTGAIDRVVDAAQGLVTDEIALARMNLEATVVGTFVGSALLAVGGLLGLGAWAVLMIAAHEILTTQVQTSSLASLGIIAGVNAAIAIAFMAVGAGRLREPSSPPAAVDRR
jgi:Putative Actinobacterial Holin-X, holin superfamily III